MTVAFKKVMHDFVAMHVPVSRVSGGGDVVFFHGFMGDHRDYLPLIDQLDKSILASSNIYLCDLPGHGASRLEGRALDLPQVLQTIGDALTSLGVHRPAFVGYSMGGRVALALADRETRGLFLESSSWGFADKVARRDRLERDLLLLQAVIAVDDPARRREAFRSFLCDWYNAPLFAGTVAHPGFKALLESRLQADVRELQRGLALLSVGNFQCLFDKLVGLASPVVWLCGERDDAYRAMGEKIQGVSRLLKVHIAPHSAHNIHFQQSQAYLEQLGTFLRQIGAKG